MAHHIGRTPRKLRVGAGDSGDQALHEPQPAPHQLGPGSGQLVVEHVEGGRGIVTTSAALQQRVAVTQHPVVVGARGFVARRENDEQVVEVSPVVRAGPPFTSAKSSGAKIVTRNNVEPVARSGKWVPVHQHSVAPRHPQLGVEGLASAVVVDDRSHDGLLTSCADQRGVGDAPERPAQRDPGHGLEQCGLARRR